MRRVEDAAAQMGVLVDDLLLLARLDQQRPLDRAPVDVVALAADAVNDAQAFAPDRAITLDVAAGDAAIVRGDELRLRQVLANLVSNALSHTPAGTPIHVEVAVRSGEVHLSVRDRGPGLAPDDAARIFERFFRPTPPAPGPRAAPALACPSSRPSSRRTAGGRRRHRARPGRDLLGAPAAGPRRAAPPTATTPSLRTVRWASRPQRLRWLTGPAQVPDRRCAGRLPKESRMTPTDPTQPDLLAFGAPSAHHPNPAAQPRHRAGHGGGARRRGNRRGARLGHADSLAERQRIGQPRPG